MMFLVDTNIISELARIQPNPGVVAWAKTVSNISLSAVTVEEICFGLTWKPNPRIQSWFDGFLRRHCYICAVTEEIARCAGRLRGALAAQGHTRTQTDMLIAATAQVHQQTLVTRNIRDFEGCGIALFNPFS
jgi:predicted nucleic acid-binding protein